MFKLWTWWFSNKIVELHIKIAREKKKLKIKIVCGSRKDVKEHIGY